MESRTAQKVIWIVIVLNPLDLTRLSVLGDASAVPGPEWLSNYQFVAGPKLGLGSPFRSGRAEPATISETNRRTKVLIRSYQRSGIQGGPVGATVMDLGVELGQWTRSRWRTSRHRRGWSGWEQEIPHLSQSLLIKGRSTDGSRVGPPCLLVGLDGVLVFGL